MQIQLKQAEIVTALKMYIVSQGIILAGKEVNISFTAGRKEAGVLADISIEDAVVQTYGNPADAAPVVEAPVAVVAAEVAAPAVVAEAEPEVRHTEEVTATAEPEPVTKANSLFS
jgi:hypothetical protein